jgi:hypothetical protein
MTGKAVRADHGIRGSYKAEKVVELFAPLHLPEARVISHAGNQGRRSIYDEFVPGV